MYHTHNMTHGHGASGSVYRVNAGGDSASCLDTNNYNAGWTSYGVSVSVNTYEGDTGGSREYTNDTGSTETRPKNLTYRIWKRIR